MPTYVCFAVLSFALLCPAVAAAAPICVTTELDRPVDTAPLGPCIPYANRVVCRALPVATEVVAGVTVICLPTP